MISKHTVIIGFVVVVIGLSMTMTPAVAQSANQSDADDSDRIAQQIDYATHVEDWSYDEQDEQFTINISTDHYDGRTVSIMEAIADSSGGSQSLNAEQVHVDPDKTTSVTIDAETNRQGAAGVVLTTDAGMSDGQAALIIHNPDSSLPDANLGFGVAIGIITMVVGMGLAYHRRYNVTYEQIQEGWK